MVKRMIRGSPERNYKEERAFDWEITEKGLDYLEKKEIERTQERNNHFDYNLCFFSSEH